MEIEGVNNMMEVHKNIEDDVVEQILSTLPPKSLMRFKCVSKRWYALITDPRFVAKHFSISKLHYRSTPCVLLKRLVNKDNDSETREVFSMLKFRNNIDNDGEGDEHSFVTGVEDIDIPPSLSLKTEGSTLHIIGHCNGIICLVPVISGEVILWNPATHEFKPLPPQPYLPDSPEIVEVPLDWPENDPLRIHRDYMDSLGFGYDPRSNDYKVVNIGYPGIDYAPNIDVGYDINLPPKTAVYSLSTDSWREMKTFSLETESTILFPEHFQMCFKGMCYWSGYELPKEIFCMDSKETWPIIILFDLGEELFHEMLLPDSVTDESVWCQSYRLLVWNESIALFGLQSSRSPNGWESVGIWVIDEFDGPKSPWTKHVSFELIEKPLAFLKSDEILMADTKNTKGHLLSYNLSTKKLKYLPIQSVQDDSDTVVYDNYSIVSISGVNKLENKDNATRGGSSLLEYSSFPSSMVGNEWHSYSVWAMPPDDASLRLKKVMQVLRSEFGGPEIEPHITMVWSLRMKHVDVLDKFRSLQSRLTSLQSRLTSRFKAKVKQVVIRSFYYQCVSLVIQSYSSRYDEGYELWKATGACGTHFGSENSVGPQVSLLYGNLTEEERRKAQEKVRILDESITSMSFPITRLALYKIDYKDKTLKSWEKIDEYSLR